MNKEKVKDDLYYCMMDDRNMSVAKALIDMLKRQVYSNDDLGQLTLSDMYEVNNKVEADKFLSERFENIISLTDELIVLRDTYEHGIVSLPGYVAQAEFKIISLVKGQQRVGTCDKCGQDKDGAMEFICNDCEIIPE